MHRLATRYGLETGWRRQSGGGCIKKSVTTQRVHDDETKLTHIVNKIHASTSAVSEDGDLQIERNIRRISWRTYSARWTSIHRLEAM